MTHIKSSQPVPLKKVRISDLFWTHYVDLVRNTVIPYQWEALNDRIPGAERSNAVKNFQIAAGIEKGEFYGCVFQDSDLAKWLETVGYSLETHPDSQLEAIADGIIDVIEKAQQPGGYLDTYYIVKEPGNRWTNLYENHELYVAGHMMEAAVAYYNGTGKRKLLDVMCRFADHIGEVFGDQPGKLRGYDGHQEVELALVKLYRATGNEKYLKLSQYFIDERGREPNFFNGEREKYPGKGCSYCAWERSRPLNLEYNQAHKPVREQEVATGHAVRGVYMYTGMADLAGETGDRGLLDACRRLWRNIIEKQMYITGGIGSTRFGEAFSFDYDLPNDTIYAESCASIGLVFFAHRMLQMERDSQYADVMERVLYNVVPGAMSRDGKYFFYVNPLEVWPEASQKNPGRRHVKAVRQKWFGCACCPPNIARLLASLNQYIYSIHEDTIYTHLYIGGEAEIEKDGKKLVLRQENSYPWDGGIKLCIVSSSLEEITLALRIPGWCTKWSVFINGDKTEDGIQSEKGYVRIQRNWKAGDEVELRMEMPVQLMRANPKVRADAGKVAIQRGPVIYCLEEADNGENLSALSLDVNSQLITGKDEALPEDVVVIRGKAVRDLPEGWDNNLYMPYAAGAKEVEIKAVPYFLWGNRKPGEMLVWIRLRER